MLNGKSVPLLQMALVSRERIKTGAKPQVETDSMVQWLRETAGAAPMVISAKTGLIQREFNPSDRPVTADNTHSPLAGPGSESTQSAGGVSAKHVKKLHRRIDTLEREVQTVTSQNRHLRQQVQTLERTERETRSTANELSRELAWVKRRYRAAQQRLKDAGGKELQWRRTSLELNQRIRDLELENGHLVDKVASLLAEVEVLNQKLATSSQAGSARRGHVAACEASNAFDTEAHGPTVGRTEDVPSDVGHRDRHVVNEELGFLDAENGVFRFRFACDAEAVEIDAVWRSCRRV